MRCPHGHDGYTPSTCGDDEISACCGAAVTYTGDGVLVCKCCFADIDATFDPIIIDLGGTR